MTQSSRIVAAIGGRSPVTMIYELFLDENGEKISKSKGNGLTIEEWMAYGERGEPGLLPVPRSQERPSNCMPASYPARSMNTGSSAPR